MISILHSNDSKLLKKPLIDQSTQILRSLQILFSSSAFLQFSFSLFSISYHWLTTGKLPAFLAVCKVTNLSNSTKDAQSETGNCYGQLRLESKLRQALDHMENE